MKKRLSKPARLALVVATLSSALTGVGLSEGISVAAAATCSNGYVALTYDDGPKPGTTVAILDALKAGGAKATFFVQGNNSQANPELVKAIADAGMWIGNHSWDHSDMPGLSQTAMQQQISSTNQQVQSITGQTPKLFRPPYGSTSDTLKAVEAALGMTEIIWTIDPQDWNSATTEDTIVSAVAKAVNGDIVLMHDPWNANTISAIPKILSGLSSRGLCAGMIQPGTGKVVAPDGSTSPTTTSTSSRTTTTTSATTTSSRLTTTTSSSQGTGSCAVTWTVDSSWQGGLQATVTVKNNGTTAINGWTVGATLPSGQTLVQVYNGSFTASGQQVTIKNASYNGSLPVGGSASSGMQIAWTTSNGPATNLTLNGSGCGGTSPTTTTSTSSRPTTTTTTTSPTTTTTTTTTTRPTTTTCQPMAPGVSGTTSSSITYALPSSPCTSASTISVTAYRSQSDAAAGTNPVGSVSVPRGTTSATITGLQPNTDYWSKVDWYSQLLGPTRTSATTTTTTTTTTTSSRPTTTTTSSQGTGSCAVSWNVDTSWQGGLQATVTVKNNGTSPINGWTVGATLPSGQTLVQVYNGSFAASGQQVTIKNASYNGTVPAGGSTSTGMQIAWTTSNGPATNLTLDGSGCGGGTPSSTTTTRSSTTGMATTTTRP